MEITLNILAKDIYETNYHNSKDCAITRALERAGIDARDCGVCIRDNKTNDELINFSNDVYRNLAGKIVLMYDGAGKLSKTKPNNALTPEDFEVTLNILNL